MDKLFFALFMLLLAACVGAAEKPLDEPVGMYYAAEDLIRGRNKMGESCKQDYGAGVALLEEVLRATEGVSSNLGVRADAMFLMGRCYANGLGVKSNSTMAVQLFHKAGKIGKCWAVADEAMCYFAGLGVAQDNKKGLELLKKAVEDGADPKKSIADGFVIDMGNRFAKQEGTKNYTLADEARENLALCYMMGIGCERDDALAAELLNVSEMKFANTREGLLVAYYLFKHGEKSRANDILLAQCDDLCDANVAAAQKIWHVGQWNKFFVYPGEQMLDEMISCEMTGAMGQAILRAYAGDYVKRDVNRAIDVLSRVYANDKKLGLKLIDHLCAISTARFPQEADALVDRICGLVPNDCAMLGYVGHLYLKGDNLRFDEKKAVKFLAAAANGGDNDAQMDYGLCFENGIGVNTNLTEAARWYKMAADGGNVAACQNYGLALVQGRGLRADVTNGVVYVRKGAVGGDSLAQLTYGTYCLYGIRGVDKDVRAAIAWLSKAVSNGCARAHYHLGVAYSESTDMNLFLSLENLKKAKDNNDARANDVLENLIRFCTDVPDFETNDVKDYKKGAESGDGWSQYLYARALYLGLGCEADVLASFDWAMKSARQGNREGVNLVAMCLFDMGDISTALKWEDAAIKRGSVKAMFNRSGHYFLGRYGFPRDLKMAYRYVEIAALCGNAAAVGKQGAMVYFGMGVEQSKEKGLELMKCAANLGDEDSKKYYEKLKGVR